MRVTQIWNLSSLYTWALKANFCQYSVCLLNIYGIRAQNESIYHVFSTNQPKCINHFLPLCLRYIKVYSPSFLTLFKTLSKSFEMAIISNWVKRKSVVNFVSFDQLEELCSLKFLFRDTLPFFTKHRFAFVCLDRGPVVPFFS